MKTLCEESSSPTQRTYELLILACTEKSSLVDGQWVHRHLLENGFDQDPFLATKLITMYSSLNQIGYARKVFDKTRQRTIYITTTLIDMYAKFGCVDYAIAVFDQMPVSIRNVVSWSAMIACYAKNGFGFEALELFKEMMMLRTRSVQIHPNSVTMVSVLQACASLAAMEQGKVIHGYILRNRLNSIKPVMSGLVTMYAKCGKLELAQRVFDGIENPDDVVCWNSMISGYGSNGEAKKAIDFFNEMIRFGVSPSSVSFVSVLGACSHAGLVEEGKALFDSMKSRFGMVPAVEHYAAMVDLLGRANRLEEAIKLVEDMRIEPGPKVWGSVLGSSRIHCNVELAERASKRLFELEPTNAGNYVVLADTYAGAGMWDEVNRVKKMIESKGLGKMHGRSWIEVKREMYSFVSVDRFDHARSEQLHALVFELAVQMKEKGYVPRTNVVLYDLEPEEKERIVLGHSEKLALAFGLVNTSHGEVIRITKNLRLCEDCHEFTKFISKFAGKEILVRDVNRLHRFRDGVCSCGDFW
ncbi:Pentatricopeptide repeat-containing protein At3g46790, chloroplastic [Linum grandiflorum]